MINLRQKMVFATGTWHCCGEFAVTERPAERRDSTDEPKHQQRKSRLNIFQLKTETREDPGPDDVGDHDRARSYKTDGPPGRCRLDRSRMCKRGHLSQMLLNFVTAQCRTLTVQRQRSVSCLAGDFRQLSEALHGRISIVVPSGVTRQSSSISSSVTAIQPAVQSFQR